jgi:putative oxidoreductase
MYLLNRIDAWSERHHPQWIDLLRVLLGLILFWKGIFFIRHTHEITLLIQSDSFQFYSMSIAHYVIGAHIVGGILITFGLLTRAAAIFQIPALIGALVVSDYLTGISNLTTDTELAVFVLLLLIFFIVEGSGRLSVDEYIRKHPEE